MSEQAPLTRSIHGSVPEQLDRVVIRFAGDSGDGMQLTGDQFARSTALMGNDLATLPNFPAEIRAPAGTTFGVSSFQIQFSSASVATPGDNPDVLVAMNPAALKVNLADLPRGGTLIVNTSAFTRKNLGKAGYASNPLADGSLEGYHTIDLDIGNLTLRAVKDYGLSPTQAQRCKNFWALGLVSWMYDRNPQPTREWLRQRFAGQPKLLAANTAALEAGYAHGETAELGAVLCRYRIPPADRQAGVYRTITGTTGLAWGLLAGAHKTGLELFFSSYPITPASGLLHTLAKLRFEGLSTFQAEDEIAAACAAIGASYAGAIGVTASSGPGMALKTEALGLAIACELPLVAIDCQRAGPSTGMPTKTEQSDLFQAVVGRNGDAPLVVLAPASPGDCFFMAAEAIRLATKYMTPVIVLADGYLINAAEPWAIPDVASLPDCPVRFHTDPEGFHPFLRDPETLARVWAIPGTPGLVHRIGGLEKDYDSGHISYSAANHQRMTALRAAKIQGIAADIPLQSVHTGTITGRLAVVSWGSTFGAVNQAVQQVRLESCDVAHIHLRYLSPLPRNLGELLAGFDKVLVPELNNGQLVRLLRHEYLVPARGFNQVTGLPFKVSDLKTAIHRHLES